MLNKMNMIAFFFLSLSACDGPVVVIGEDAATADDSPVDVPEEVVETFLPLCSEPFTCTPERACDMTPVVLAYDTGIPFKVEGSFSSPPVTYGIADDAFLKVTWWDLVIEWNHIPSGNHTFSIEYSCAGSTWTVTATLDDETTIHTATTSAPECSTEVTFMPAINAAPDCEFGPICTAE